MNEERLVFEIAKQENRPNPYPLYAQARQVGICRQHDGAYVVSRYREVSALLHDPRVSSDPRNFADPPPPPPAFPFIMQDAPNHDRLRRIAMNQFGPPDHDDRHPANTHPKDASRLKRSRRFRHHYRRPGLRY